LREHCFQTHLKGSNKMLAGSDRLRYSTFPFFFSDDFFLPRERGCSCLWDTFFFLRLTWTSYQADTWMADGGGGGEPTRDTSYPADTSSLNKSHAGIIRFLPYSALDSIFSQFLQGWYFYIL
jgi:hypothetical protein